jgi:RNA polymerase sigma-70 factor (ECF subfamily)
MVEALMGEAERRSDRDLVKRFRAGDRDAFLALYRAHSPAVFRFAMHMTGDRIRAEGLTQDVFVWLIHHAADFDAERGELGAFLGGVARKLLHSQQRTERRWLPLEESAAGGAGFDAGLEREQEAAGLRRAIAALPERYREAVVLCDLEGKSYQEVAAIQGCAVGTVRSRLHRARELLARKFQHKREGLGCL